MEEFVLALQNKSNDVSTLMKTFIEENENGTRSPEIDNSLRKQLWAILFEKLEDVNLTFESLGILKILARDKTDLSLLASKERIEVLFKCFCIDDRCNYNKLITVEAFKCLCNITYNFPEASELLLSLNAIDLFANKLLQQDRRNIENSEIISFEVRLLFLITAFSQPSRLQFYEKFGLKFFTNFFHDDAKYFRGRNDVVAIKLCCNVLKMAFNVLLVLNPDGNTTFKEDELKELVASLRELISISFDTMCIISDCVNLITLIPKQFLGELIIPNISFDKKSLIWSRAFGVVNVLINFLEILLTKSEEVPGTSKEELIPILIVLTNASRVNNLIRKYIRNRILPYLRDVHSRPEVGNSIRNRLCRLLGCPLTTVRDQVAELMFVICKENVGRMVKYTGYGNAAGHFASRGLLRHTLDYSSDSEDSETEEYKEHKDLINPIVGCVTQPKGEEENMSEEQKEYLAMQLVNQIDRLNREGVFQPAVIGADGRPEPISHVLQLKEGGMGIP